MFGLIIRLGKASIRIFSLEDECFFTPTRFSLFNLLKQDNKPSPHLTIYGNSQFIFVILSTENKISSITFIAISYIKVLQTCKDFYYTLSTFVPSESGFWQSLVRAAS